MDEISLGAGENQRATAFKVTDSSKYDSIAQRRLGGYPIATGTADPLRANVAPMREQKGQSLFTTLGRYANSQSENYATDALAWLLANDDTTLRAFLDLCAKAVETDLARSVLTALGASTAVDIATQVSIKVTGAPGKVQRCQLDLQLLGAGQCLVVEIKIDAPPTMHRRDDPDADKANEQAARMMIEQTATYRRWLDTEYPSRSALLTLTLWSDPALSAHAHGSFSWQQLRDGFRALPPTSMLSHQFCDYLEDRGMARPSYPAIDLSVKQLADDRAVWRRLGVLLAEATTELADAVHSRWPQEEPMLQDVRYLGMHADDDGLLLWNGWLLLRASTRPKHPKVWFTIYLLLPSDSTKAMFPLVAVSHHGLTEKGVRDLLQLDVKPDDDYGFVCTLELPTDFETLPNLHSQAKSLVDLAMTRVVKPILGQF